MDFDSTGYSREGPGRGGGVFRQASLDCLICDALWEDYLEFSNEDKPSSCLWKKIQEEILRIEALADR